MGTRRSPELARLAGAVEALVERCTAPAAALHASLAAAALADIRGGAVPSHRSALLRRVSVEAGLADELQAAADAAATKAKRVAAFEAGLAGAGEGAI